MAFSTEITTRIPAADLPAGFTNPTVTALTGQKFKEPFSYTVGISGLSHASVAATGLTQVLAAVTTWIEGTFGPDDLKIDVAQTVDGVIYVDRIERINSAASIYITGTEQYKIDGVLEWQ